MKKSKQIQEGVKTIGIKRSPVIDKRGTRRSRYSAFGLALRAIPSGRRRQSLRRSTRADARIVGAVAPRGGPLGPRVIRRCASPLPLVGAALGAFYVEAT
jgi:hypothetical protein